MSPVSRMAQPEREEVSAATLRYLEAAYYLAGEGLPIRRARLAQWLGISAPSVTEAVGRLIDEGLLQAGPGRLLQLTSEGQDMAARVVRRHRIIEAWAVMSLGLDWVAADEEAQRLAPVVSERVLDRMHQTIGRPSCCPHGNPIPGEPVPSSARCARRLVDLGAGERAEVVRISELAEHDAHDVLDEAYRARLVPTTPITVVSVDDEGTMVLEVRGHRARVRSRVASAVWVTGSGSRRPAA